MMKRIQTLISVSAVAAVTALPVFAQQADYTMTRMGNESAEQIAQRVGACGEAGFTAANFETDALIRVTCVDGMAGGLRTGAAIGGALAAVALVGLASDGSGSTTTTTTTTTGTTN
jgi:hypothetical protein